MNYLKHKRESVFFFPIKHFIRVFFFLIYFIYKTHKKRSKIIIILIFLGVELVRGKKESFVQAQRQRVD